MLNGELVAKIPCHVLAKRGLIGLHDIEGEEWKKLLEETILPEAIKEAVRWLSVREMTTKEVRDRLHRRGYSAEIQERVIDYLKQHKYLDDWRFVEALIELREGSRPYGRYRLISDLKAKGLSEEVVERALEVFNEHRALKAAMRLGSRRGLSGQKLYNFLYRRGFSSDLISQTLSEHNE